MPSPRTVLASLLLLAFAACSGPSLDPETAERLQELRNLGKSFYENPTGADQAVETLRQALELHPDSVQEKINYALAQLRAGAREEGIAGLEEAQQLDPSVPHTWFNLGIEYKQLGDNERAVVQFEQMAQLDPNEPKTQYNLGQIYRQLDREEEAAAKFLRASELDPSLSAPHFQLFNMLRRSDADRARTHLTEFQRIKQIQDDTGLTEDVNWSFYSELYDRVEPSEPADFVTTVTFKSAEVGTVGSGGDATLLDVDRDGNTDVLVWSADAVVLLQGDGATLSVKETALAEGWTGVRRAAAGDPNNDGFPDICLARADGVFVVSNVGGVMGTPSQLSAEPAESCLWHDYDHDGDHDLFALGAESRLYRYALDPDQSLSEGFEAVEFPFDTRGTALDAVAVELFEDNGLDLVVAYEDAVVVHQDLKLGVFAQAIEIEDSAPGAGPVHLQTADFDSNGYLDISATPEGGETLILRNEHGALHSDSRIAGTLAWIDTQNRGWRDSLTAGGVNFNEGALSFAAGIVEGLPSDAVAAVELDANGDGRLDVVMVDAAGGVHLATNQTETTNRWISFQLTGVKSRIIAADARVEVKAGRLYSKRVYPGYPIVVGVGQQDAVETVRVTWPNGLIQNQVVAALDQAMEIEEQPRLSGSCPMIYTWNGEEFEYISEVLGVAPLGASLGNGQFFPVDHDEYVLLRGDQLAERDGFFDVRVTEELREVAYIDQVRLIAVDRPSAVDLYTTEKFKAPPFPEFELFGVAENQKIRPSRAVDHRDRDVLAQITQLDGDYVDGFERSFSNTAELHWLTIDLDGFAGNDQSMLFLHGWVDWAAASTIVAGSQTATNGIQPPVLQVRDGSGEWVTIDADPGLPGGNPRTMVVDLTGKFLTDSRELRILTNMCVYWDEIFAVDGVQPAAAVQRDLSMTSAQLRFRGFSQNVVHPDRLEPEKFIYSRVSTTTSWDPTPGHYTDYGSVDDLLSAVDDRFVVMAAGDELQLRFPADLPPVAEGWTRQYLLFFDGWAKEHDPNTAFGDTVEPLPFHRMSGYPYGENESFPSDAQRELVPRTQREALRLNRPLYER
jgi:tetratricopeptide (TPR) repeat protein